MLLRLLTSFALTASAILAADLDSALFERLEWRNIGPSLMGGRVTSIAGIAGNPTMVYVATASGELFKTFSSGTTLTPVFDRPSSISIGDIAVDPHNPDVVWLDAGE